MAYKLIEKFKEIIGEDPVFTLHAAIAPAFVVFPWSQGERPLHALCINKGRTSHFAINEREYFGLATDMFREYFEGRVSIEDLAAQYAAYEGDADQLYDEVTDTDLTKLSDEELRSYTHEVRDSYIELLKTIYIETIDYDKILSVIGLDHKTRLDAIWEHATQSTFVSFEGRYLGKLIDIVSSGEENSVRKASYIFTDYSLVRSAGEISLALDDVREHLAEKKAEFDALARAAKAKKGEYDLWLATVDQESRRIAEYMQLVMRLRDIRKDPIAKMLAVSSELVTEMLTRAGVDVRFLSTVSILEYVRGIDYLKSVKDHIEKRDAGVIYLAYPDLSCEVEHSDFDIAAAELEDWIQSKHGVHESDELRGQTACRGTARGTVRVVSDPHDDKGFQDGDILVTSMTRPEFVPIMKRAGGVVTNEGGITCHAAIVSRELGIPCVIGTKNATRFLKDGDMVEVDANSGVVRILK